MLEFNEANTPLKCKMSLVKKKFKNTRTWIITTSKYNTKIMSDLQKTWPLSTSNHDMNMSKTMILLKIMDILISLKLVKVNLIINLENPN
jgi:hypothetical protein